MNKTLKMLLPTTLPMAKSGLPLRQASTETANSGALVPKATMVSPITSGEIRTAAASFEAPRTNNSPPPTNTASPPAISSQAQNVSFIESPPYRLLQKRARLCLKANCMPFHAWVHVPDCGNRRR